MLAMMTDNSDKNAIDQMGWHFEHSYAQLPDLFYSSTAPVPVSDPSIVIINDALSEELGLSVEALSQEQLAQLFSGNVLPASAQPIAQAYAGHQFGHFAMLGDGRAHLIGEQITSDQKRVDIQFKGSGQTPYSRQGDGRAALGPMLREYVISEAMHALGIPTTRSLAVVTTGEPVLRETMLQGAILTRVASSHLRVGTFEYTAAQRDVVLLRQFTDYAIDRHYSDLEESENPYLAFVEAVMKRQVTLVVDWLRVGFIHGVMNTDNTTISGETIDYGPCAFMDAYDPQTVFSSIDHMGRYAYANQPHMVQWNIARFAEALLPLLHDDMKQGIALAEELIDSFSSIFQHAWLQMMRQKLGLLGEEKGDEKLISDWLKFMQREHADYTNSFRDLMVDEMPTHDHYQSEEFIAWWQCWQARRVLHGQNIKASTDLMCHHNPAIIPRNHLVEKALEAAEESKDFAPFHELLSALHHPYDDALRGSKFSMPPAADQRVYQTFCGT